MIKVFFLLIKIAIGHASKLPRPLTDRQWKCLYRVAEEQTLLGVLYPALERLPQEQRPSKEIIFKWYTTAEMIRESNRRMNKEAVELAKMIGEELGDNVLMKGQGIATLYPDPSLRMPGDIDLWVKGERSSIIDYVKRGGQEEQIVYHNITFHHFAETPVEIHFTPSWMNSYFHNRRLQRFFKRSFDECSKHRISLPESAGEISVPTKMFNAVFILQHIFRHLFGDGIGLRQMMDYYYVLQLGFSAVEIQIIRNQLKSLGMYKFAGAVMFVMKEVFGLPDNKMLVPINEKEGAYLLSEIMRAGNFGKFDSRIVHPENENKIHSFWRINKQVVKHIGHYPSEVCWSPVYRAWHFCWRKYHGWI